MLALTKMVAFLTTLVLFISLGYYGYNTATTYVNN